ncbi:MAG: O-acetyl-ADP-ribose deacetylase [Desulfobacteraceae bacterium]|nr:O-acetyl-ADP-ribose deacetylase [Desulfobacteraceae bacterium]MCB9494837.1 O-acetyl-ADP-ribose deacetylase [Desulfobacteraceae bacterium]
MNKISDQIQILKGDITKIKADAIVNAANTSLLGGGGVDGAIHHAAGPELLEECRRLNGCKTGEAKLTRAYLISTAQYIIHTPGPVYKNLDNDSFLLENSYKNSLLLAFSKELNSIAFPAISCGVYGYPPDKAARIAITTVINFLKKNTFPKKVIFVLFSDDLKSIYDETFNELKNDV